MQNVRRDASGEKRQFAAERLNILRKWPKRRNAGVIRHSINWLRKSSGVNEH